MYNSVWLILVSYMRSVYAPNTSMLIWYVCVDGVIIFLWFCFSFYFEYIYIILNALFREKKIHKIIFIFTMISAWTMMHLHVVNLVLPFFFWENPAFNFIFYLELWLIIRWKVEIITFLIWYEFLKWTNTFRSCWTLELNQMPQNLMNCFFL